MRTKIIIILLFCSCLTFSQKNNNSESLNILIVQGEKQIESLIINKDTTRCSISFYINGFETKKKREKAICSYKKNAKNNSLGLPTFSINFISSWKPEKLVSLNGIDYISITEFIKSNLKTTNPTFIILKQNDGSYLKWKVIILSPE